jgi:hypothetical protein
MPKYLIEASYSAEGAKGIMKRGWNSATRCSAENGGEPGWTP